MSNARVKTLKGLSLNGLSPAQIYCFHGNTCLSQPEFSSCVCVCVCLGVGLFDMLVKSELLLLVHI